MLRKLLLPIIFALLAYGFWISPDLKEVAAGVAIFLFGMLSLEQGFRAFSGGLLERILRRSTDRLWKSLGFGIVTTTLMQSSTLVSLLTISFISAGMLGLVQGVGIIFGANLGTTTGAWLMAGLGLKVNTSTYALPILAFGIILIFQSSKPLKGLGYVLTGLGFLFLGIHYMKEGFEAFRDGFDLSGYSVDGLAGVLLFSLVGILATVVMQSSHATLVLIITALSAGQISYDNALSLAVGANVGTTVTAILGAMGANIAGKRLAGAHLLFNLVTGVLAIMLMSELIQLVDSLGRWLGIDPADFSLKLALFHTLFNLLGLLVMLPLIQPLVRLLNRLLKPPVEEVDGPVHIFSAAIEYPETALEVVRRETLHVYDNARDIIVRGLAMSPEQVFSDRPLSTSLQEPNLIYRVDIGELYNRRVKRIFSAVIAFISAADAAWKGREGNEFHWLRDANRHIVEAVKAAKHLQKNLYHYLLSDNHHIRQEYNRLRIQVAELLRQLQQLRESDEPNDDLLGMDELRLSLREFEKQQSKRLFRLIRENRITPEMGTSLMNDSGYVSRLCSALVDTATTLFALKGRDIEGVERQMTLDTSEIDEVLDHQP